MRFQVPQFIDVEDKIFGPFTLKQFIYLAGGAGIALMLFTLLPKFFAFVLSAPFVGLSAALAFYKPNNRPFVDNLESMVRFFFGERLYVWKKIPKKVVMREGDEYDLENLNILPPQLTVPHLSGSKLKDMNWNLDVKKPDENLKTGL
jgi:hypothetical protein